MFSAIISNDWHLRAGGRLSAFPPFYKIDLRFRNGSRPTVMQRSPNSHANILQKLCNSRPTVMPKSSRRYATLVHQLCKSHQTVMQTPSHEFLSISRWRAPFSCPSDKNAITYERNEEGNHFWLKRPFQGIQIFVLVFLLRRHLSP